MGDDLPSYISQDISESILLNDNPIDTEESLTLEKQSLNSLPGGWLYHNYEVTRIDTLRLLHIIGYSLEVFCYFFSEIWIGFNHTYSNVPFETDPIFGTLAWGIICLLGGLLLPVLFSSNKYSLSLLTDKLRFSYYPVYIFLGAFFISRQFKINVSGEVITTISLSIILLAALIVYYQIKVLSSKIKINWLEYFAGSVLISLLSSFVFLSLVSTVVEIIYNNMGSSNHNFLGWQGENWVILLMTLVFGVGAIVLSMFNDPWFASMISFYYFGIYSCQLRFVCRYKENTCSYNVKIGALALAVILNFFIMLNFALKRKIRSDNVR